jgi:phage portal protein BeeE
MGIIADLFTRSYRTSPKNLPQGSSSLIFQERGRVGKSSGALFRNWAEHSEWVRAAVNIRKAQVSSAEWDIVPFDQEQDADENLQKQLRDLFNRPNLAVESFRSWVEPILEDILVLDAGTIEKERTLGGQIAFLHAVDGAKIKVSSIWDGDPEETRYWWVPTPQYEVPFRNEDLVYIMANPRTYSVLGLSPLETLKLTIDSEVSGSMYNSRQVTNAAPDGMLDLGEGARPEQIEGFKSYWLSEVAGKGAMAFIGGTKGAKFVPFRGSNREMQYQEWLLYLVRKIAAVYGISPQDLGLTFDINRATAESQMEMTEDRGLRPLLALVQDYFTREIVWDESFGGTKNNLAFRFTRLNIKESMSKASINKLALAGMPWKPVNEARIDEGRAPLGDPNDPENPYNKLMANTPLGVVTVDDVMTAKEVATPPPPAPTAGQSKPDPGKKAEMEALRKAVSALEGQIGQALIDLETLPSSLD